MKALVAIALGAALLGGCDQRTGPEPNRGVTRPGRGAAGPAASRAAAPRRQRTAPTAPPWERTETVHPARPFATARRTDAEGAEPAEGPRSPSPTPTGAHPGEQPRNLGAELHDAVGNPAACLAGEASEQLPDQISLAVTAHVSATGIVTRADVSAPGLPDEAVRCVESRVEATQLRGPIANAPATVTTTLTFKRD